MLGEAIRGKLDSRSDWTTTPGISGGVSDDRPPVCAASVGSRSRSKRRSEAELTVWRPPMAFSPHEGGEWQRPTTVALRSCRSCQAKYVTLREVLNDLAIDIGLVEDRAGRYSRQLARDRQRAFIGASWRRLLVIFIVGIALTGLTEFLPSWARGFVAGAWLASVVWFLTFLIVQLSGSAPMTMATTAEQWTAQELRRLRRRGWKVVSHTTPKYGDIDHIAVGPGGLLVIETKWRSDPSDFDDQGWLTAGCRKLSENARLVRLSLQARLQTAPTRTAFVCWSPGGFSGSRFEPVEVEGVAVIPGPKFRVWLDHELGQTPAIMDNASIDSAWETLAGLARSTDRREFKKAGPPPTTPVRHLFDGGIGVVTGLVAFFLSSLLLRWRGPSLLFPLMVVLTAAASSFYLSKRTPILGRTIALGATVGFGSFLAVSAALYAYFGLAHT